MARMKFTTSQVGGICGVSQQTVIKWVDSGELEGYRLPNSRDRRITDTGLLRFMKKHGMPTDALEEKGKTRILVVDDEVTIGLFIKEVFRDHQEIEVRAVERGFDAGIVNNYRPHLIFLDIMLPDIDGRRVCELIRKGSGGREVKIIGISGYASSIDRNELEKAGFDDFLPKPFDADTIRNVLEKNAGEKS